MTLILVEAEQVRITFGVVADQWFQKYKGSWKDFARNRHCKSLSRDIIPLIGDKRIDDITKADLLLIIKPHEDLGHLNVAHRLYALKTPQNFKSEVYSAFLR